MPKRYFPLFACFLLTLTAVPLKTLASDSIATTPAKFRVTFEDTSLPDDEKMGFLGGTYLYNISDRVSLGPALYGALTGERGGFITLGGAAEYQLPFADSYEFNTGLFLGAGGGRGGFRLSGGGLMLRYHAGIKYMSDDLGHFGLGLSYLDFPDGRIHSTQPYVSYEYPFQTLIASGWEPKQRGSNSESSESESLLNLGSSSAQELAIIFKRYQIPDDVRTDAGTPQFERIDLVGMEWNKYLGENVYLHTEAEGAMGGKSQGYMQVFLGGGYRLPLGQSNAIKLAGSAGFAGGGAVDTGGGLILDASLSFQQMLTDKIYVEGSAGYVLAPDGDLKAASLAAKLGYALNTPYVDDSRMHFSGNELMGFDVSHFRIRAAHQYYQKADPNWRGHNADKNVGNLGIQMDAFICKNLFLTGQGMAAYSGKAGAYMAGLLGGGVHLPIADSPLFIDAELVTGAAGGGGLDVNGGFVWQTNVGMGYQVNDDISVIAQYGYMEAPKGNFKADVITFSLGYNFSLFTR